MSFGPGITRAYRRLPVCLFLCLIMAFPCAVRAAADLEELQRSADRLGLADSVVWRALLHIPDGARESLVDDPDFFLAPDGKGSASSELRASLAAFFNTVAPGDSHAICRYPARFAWLKEQLALDEAALPHPACTELGHYLSTLQPRAASIMFPAAYLNSPASMFGHTYLRIDGAYTSDLLGYAVNYSAKADESNGFLYALNGIFGRYRGYYSLLPHYAKVREYSGIEHRDIWEYRLNLTTDEVRRMALHIWELRERYADYYFFDENCSYNMLFLLAVARPTPGLAATTTPWVIPFDTVERVRRAGMISATEYRASQGRKIRWLADDLAEEELETARRLSQTGPLESLEHGTPATGRARVLDLATELLQYRYDKNGIGQDEYKGRLLQLLSARSALAAPPPPVFASPPPAPDAGHASIRASLSGGSDRGRAFVEAGFRPAYHSLDDPGIGFLPGAQIQFLNGALRYYPDRELLRLERLDLVDIISLADFERIFRQVSWKVRGSLEQIQNRRGDDVLAFRLNSGGGLARNVGTVGLAYVMAELDGNLSDGMNGWGAAGIGGSIGMLSNPEKPLSVNLAGRAFWYPVGDERTLLQGEVGVSLRLDRNNALNGSMRISDTEGHVRREWSGGWRHYF